jgi:hypothetical protein
MASQVEDSGPSKLKATWDEKPPTLVPCHSEIYWIRFSAELRLSVCIANRRLWVDFPTALFPVKRRCRRSSNCAQTDSQCQENEPGTSNGLGRPPLSGDRLG